MKFWNLWEKIGIFVITFITLIVFAVLTPSVLSKANIINLLSQSSLIAIAGMGMTFAVTGGGFDLSIGSLLALITCVLGKTVPEFGLWGGFAIALVVGIILGAFNGLIITKFKIQTFVATLATMTIYRGVSLVYTQGRDATLFGSGYQSIKIFSGGELFHIPMPVILMFLVYLTGYILYKYTSFGVYVRSIGSNKGASEISGIQVDRTIILIFIMTAVTTVFSGAILTSQLLVGTSRYGTTFALEVITAVILGGTSLAGGRGNLWGTLMAAIVLTLMKNGLNLLGVNVFYQWLATGLFLILALSISGIRELVREKSA